MEYVPYGLHIFSIPLSSIQARSTLCASFFNNVTCLGAQNIGIESFMARLLNPSIYMVVFSLLL